MSIFSTVLCFFGVSQLYWAWRARGLLRRWIPAVGARRAAVGVLAAVYLFLLAYNFGLFGRSPTPVHLTASEALFSAPFLWWMAGSVVGFILAIPFVLMDGVWRLVGRRFRREPAGEIASPGRRDFLGLTAGVVTAAPFVAGAYGLLYGRLNLETPRQPIVVPRLPAAFDGFRIVQLSDIHIGPFMPEEEIRKYAAIANALKGDLTVLTGDFVTFDARTEGPVVAALSGLRAPFGVFGCLGNHDAWSGVESSITALFRAAGIRILRGERVSIERGGDSFNLIGTGFQSNRRFGPSAPVRHLLADVESLIAPDRVNILLSHNPDTFDRAAELRIDLSLAGHTHGGQAALEFISPEWAPSRLVTPYVAGLFQKPGGQLYVNRGIGTIGIPIRIGAPPEITVFELRRA